MPRRARLTLGDGDGAPSLRPAPVCALCLAAQATLRTAGS
eukprot:COSAG01_NODE_64314_length_277_cov_0.567416_1_plen_39_part_01